MRKTTLAVALSALLGLVAGWYYGSPRWTLSQMRDAAQARDGDRLASYVDFPTLRETTKAQMKAQLAAEVAKGGGGEGGFGTLGAMMGMALVDPMIDGMLTPEMLRTAFVEKQDASARPSRKAAFDASDVRIVQRGFGEFRLRRKDARGDEGDLIFRRHGLGWKLSEVRLPNDLAKDGPGASEDVP